MINPKKNNFILLFCFILIAAGSIARIDSTIVLIEDDPIVGMLDSIAHLKYFEASKTQQTTPNKYGFAPNFVPTYSDSVYAARIAKLDAKSPFDLQYNQAVKKYIDLYAIRKREQVSRMLGLAELYFPMFEEKLDKYNIPLEMKYLAIVESAMNPRAKSRCGAMGLWQFMYGTGKMYNLKTNSYTDDRCDPYKETEAACQFLQDLYKMFGDWHLVLAAYNAGPGNVNKAIRRSGGKKDYWGVRPFLPQETRGYVPAFIAVNYVMNYAEEHNLSAVRPIFYHYQVDTISVTQPLTFKHISTVLNIPMEELEFLNPRYRKNFIPKIEGETSMICLPKQAITAFINNDSILYDYAAKTKTDFVQEVRKWHTVKKGETIATIAKKYKCTVVDIKDWNSLRSKKVHSGQKLTIYTVDTQKETVSASPKEPKEKINSTETAVVAKDSIEIKNTSEIKIVSTADSVQTKYIYYTVQPGDTLWNIANQYQGATVAKIKKLNNIRSARDLKPGRKIKVAVGG